MNLEESIPRLARQTLSMMIDSDYEFIDLTIEDLDGFFG